MLKIYKHSNSDSNSTQVNEQQRTVDFNINLINISLSNIPIRKKITKYDVIYILEKNLGNILHKKYNISDIRNVLDANIRPSNSKWYHFL